MSKIDELLKNEKIEWRKLGEVCEILDYKRKPVTKSKRIFGKYPYYGANGIQDYIDDFIFDGTFILMGEDGSVINKDNTPILHWVEDSKIWVNNHAHVLGELDSKYILKYIYYYLTTVNVSSIVKGTPPKINQGNMRNIQIPIPPIQTQEKIVKILDNFTNYVTELQTELQLRLKQYQYYRDMLLSEEYLNKLSNTGGGYKLGLVTLGEIGEIQMCKRILKNQTSSIGEVAFYKIGTFGKQADSFISKELFDDYKEKYNYPKKGEILLSASGTIGKTVIFDGKDAYFQDSNIVWISHNEEIVLNKYLYYLYQIINWNPSTGGTINRLYNYNLKNIKILLPPIKIQKKIVEILDKFYTFINDLSKGLPKEIALRQKQYQYYREKLLSFDKND